MPCSQHVQMTLISVADCSTYAAHSRTIAYAAQCIGAMPTFSSSFATYLLMARQLKYSTAPRKTGHTHYLLRMAHFPHLLVVRSLLADGAAAEVQRSTKIKIYTRSIYNITISIVHTSSSSAACLLIARQLKCGAILVHYNMAYMKFKLR